MLGTKQWVPHLAHSSLERAGFEDFGAKLRRALWCGVHCGLCTVHCGAVWCTHLSTYCTRSWQKKLLREALEWKTQISFDRFVQHVGKVILHIRVQLIIVVVIVHCALHSVQGH